MSFFRILLALLISAAIAGGLYVAVDERRFDRAVEAVRTEIASRTGTVVEEVDTAAGEEDVAGVEAPIVAEAEGEALVMERADAQDGGTDGLIAPDADEVETIEIARTDDAAGEPDTGEAEAEVETEAESAGFAARVEQDAASAEVEETEAREATDAVDTDAPAADDTQTAEVGEEAAGEPAEPGVDEPETAAQDTEQTVGENDVPRIAAMPAPPETVLPDDAQAPMALETREALPAARIAVASDASTAALDVVNGGMNYAEARETLIEAGWSPRLPATRTGGPNVAENAMIEAGYGELEGCKGEERPICRFEFVDGEKRIAAVLTAGEGTDPSVIDAFLMNIRAE